MASINQHRYQPVDQIELDSYPPSSPRIATAKSQPGSRSTLRRRAKHSSSLPIPVMSLAALKHVFFKQSPVIPATPLSELGSQDSRPDVESQKGAKKSWKVNARVISDATIGLSDGLTVPFALTAGLSALGSTRVVIFGGLAELIAGAISMGLGGYLGAKSEAASYKASREEAQLLIRTNPQAVLADIADVFEPYNLPPSTLTDLTRHLSQSPKLIDFVMQFQHCTEEPAASRAFTSAITIALGYFLGGLLPLIPYFCTRDLLTGLKASIGVMVFALFTFGYVKTGVVVGWHGGRNIRMGCWGGLQMVIIGSVAAGSAMGLVTAFNRVVT